MACGDLACPCRMRGWAPFGETERPPGHDDDYGCTREAKREVFGMDGKTYRRCPQMVVTAESGRAVAAHAAMARGFLPASGGWIDQAASFHDAVAIIDEVYRDHDDREAERRRRRQKARGR